MKKLAGTGVTLLLIILLSVGCAREQAPVEVPPVTAPQMPAVPIRTPSRMELQLDLERLNVGSLICVQPLTGDVAALGVVGTTFSQLLLVDITHGRILGDVGLTGEMQGLEILPGDGQPPFSLVVWNNGLFQIGEDWSITAVPGTPDRYSQEDDRILVDGKTVLEIPGCSLLHLPELDHRLVYLCPGEPNDVGECFDRWYLFDTVTGKSTLLTEDGRQVLTRTADYLILGRETAQFSRGYDLHLVDLETMEAYPLAPRHLEEADAIEEVFLNSTGNRMGVTWREGDQEIVEIYDLESGLLLYQWAATKASRCRFSLVGENYLLVHCQEGELLWRVQYI